MRILRFSHRSGIYSVRPIHKCFILEGSAEVNGTVLLILNSICSLLVRRKRFFNVRFVYCNGAIIMCNSRSSLANLLKFST